MERGKNKTKTEMLHPSAKITRTYKCVHPATRIHTNAH